jgi:hypothetical protein
MGKLAKAETHREVRTVLMGMALGWLNFANHLKSNALQLWACRHPSPQWLTIIQ